MIVKKWPALKRAPGPLPTGTANWDDVARLFLEHAFLDDRVDLRVA